MTQAVDRHGAQRIELTVAEADAGIRLDKLLAQRVEGLSRARIQALIRAGHVSGPGGANIGDGSYRVKPGDAFAVEVPEPQPAAPAAEAIALDVVYEDADVIVVNKPPHLVVHPAAGHASGTLVNALIAHCGASLSGIGGVKRPGIVHRLDKGTSGLLVVAKNDAAHASLSEQFAAHGADGRMHRAYLALVWGKPLRPRGIISARLARSQSNRTKIGVTRGEGGRHAVTHYEVLETFGTDAGTGLAAASRTGDRPHASDPRAPGAHRSSGARRYDLCQRFQDQGRQAQRSCADGADRAWAAGAARRRAWLRAPDHGPITSL